MTQSLKKTTTLTVRLTLNAWPESSPLLICAGDIRRPWQSVYGFPTVAARLAVHQSLFLPAREDEIFGLLARLNGLTACPQALNQAYLGLNALAGDTCDRLARRLPTEEFPECEGESAPAAATSDQQVADRLKQLLTPDDPLQEMAGLVRQLARLLPLLRGLRTAKEQGFSVVVYDRRSLPRRPALEARRNEPVHLAGRPTALPAGFLLPPATHRTLWAYRLVRSERDQSAVWN
jgi:hypothetical protein